MINEEDMEYDIDNPDIEAEMEEQDIREEEEAEQERLEAEAEEAEEQKYKKSRAQLNSANLDIDLKCSCEVNRTVYSWRKNSDKSVTYTGYVVYKFDDDAYIFNASDSVTNERKTRKFRLSEISLLS